jgi:hypothetical protein
MNKKNIEELVKSALTKHKTTLDEARQKAYDLRIQMNLKEDIDIGHEDDEPNMIKADLYQLRKDINDLCSMVEKYDNMNTEIDFPAWWQEKITTSKAMLSGAKEYLDFESNDASLEEKKLTKAEKNKKEEIVKGMKDNFKGSEAAMYAIATDKAKKLAEIVIKKLKEVNNKEEYIISKSGPKSNPHYVLEKPDGSKQIDMMFDSPEDAKKYAVNKNLHIKVNEVKLSEETINKITWDSLNTEEKIKLLRQHFPKLSLKFADWKWNDLTPMIKNKLSSVNIK